MSQPLVSVMITTYNQINFIKETLMSALEQDYENLQVVVADDGSTDGTQEVILEYATKYPHRLVTLVGGPNLGITGNSNRALQLCKGKYIALQGGDDVLLPGKIAKQVAWLEEDSQRVICYHDVEVFDSQSGKCLYLYSQRHPMKKGGLKDLINFDIVIPSLSVMLRTSCIPSKGYDTRIPRASDWLFLIETVLSSTSEVASVGYIPGIFARYRRHDNNITDQPDIIEDTIKSLDILLELAPSLRCDILSAKSERLATYGVKKIINGKIIEGINLLCLSIKTSYIGIIKAVFNGLSYIFVKKMFI